LISQFGFLKIIIVINYTMFQRRKFVTEKIAHKLWSDDGLWRQWVWCANSDSTELHIVNSTLGCCSCKQRMTGKFCKHQLPVMQLLRAAFPNAPDVTAEARRAVALQW